MGDTKKPGIIAKAIAKVIEKSTKNSHAVAELRKHGALPR